MAVLLCIPAASATAFAANNDVTVTINGELISFDQPPIIVDGRTLVPIRAVCEKLGALVGWEHATQTVTITKGALVLSLKIGDREMRVSNENSIYLDVPPQIYNGRTLLPIRAVVEKLGCNVLWDERNRQVIIGQPDMGQSDTIMVPGVANTQRTGISNWANVSSVQQFAYKNEGLAYAYIKGGNLEITTPSKQLTLEMKYPILGDLISDLDGNFYVIWGREGSINSDQTVFISQYTGDGVHVRTTGFTGKSYMGEDGNTKIPFSHGNCVSAIGDGYLMVNYARSMYNGHQSNNVVGVKISDMSPVEYDSVWSIPYTSHSFNQSVVWSHKIGGFVYADHGDAYSRGFVITSDTGKKTIFNFYLEANANYNMFVVNKTFAQLGGLVETSKGVVFAGASAKSISEAAKNEKQNLFIQIFDPGAKEVSPSMFVGGSVRTGATATDINDNRNSPLTSVSDYGVHWLTNYTDTDVIAPQVVLADDRIVILWGTNADTFYMVLSADGTVLKPATSLAGWSLNSFESPVFHNGAIHWVSVNNEKLIVRSIDL